jgi:hypothetical protein
MAFHIAPAGGGRNFLTAGHCSGSTWYHGSYGLIGSQAGTLLCQDPGNDHDIKRVSMSSGQVTSGVYGSGPTNIHTVSAAAWPVQGATVRASMGASNFLTTGIVTSGAVTYTMTGVPCAVWGGAHNLSSIGGDSGSPVWQTSPVRAVGVHSTLQGRFGRVQNALNEWNASLVQ